MKLQWIKWLAGIVLVFSLAGCGGGEQSEGAAAGNEPTNVVYQKNCMSCHGSQLQGRVGPKLQGVGSRMTEEQLMQLIKDGRGGMPSFGKRLSEDEIASVAAWLAEQK